MNFSIVIWSRSTKSCTPTSRCCIAIADVLSLFLLCKLSLLWSLLLLLLHHNSLCCFYFFFFFRNHSINCIYHFRCCCCYCCCWCWRIWRNTEINRTKMNNSGMRWRKFWSKYTFWPCWRRLGEGELEERPKEMTLHKNTHIHTQIRTYTHNINVLVTYTTKNGVETKYGQTLN